MSFSDPLIIETFEKRAPVPNPRERQEIEPKSQMAGGKPAGHSQARSRSRDHREEQIEVALNNNNNFTSHTNLYDSARADPQSSRNAN